MDHRGIAPMDFTGNIAENWKFWIQKFKNYLVATGLNGKDEALQCAQLLHYIGDEGLRIYNTFQFKVAETNKIDVLIKRFDLYFQPKKNIVYERYRFLSRKQLDGETIQHFVTDLKNRARNCEFGELQDSMVCSMLVCGLQSDKIRERLLENGDITLEEALKICQSLEESRKHGQEIAEKQEVGAVMSMAKSSHSRMSDDGTADYRWRKGLKRITKGKEKVKSGYHDVQRPPSRSCGRCGTNHSYRNCPAYGKHCLSCNMLNHFKNVCRNKKIHGIDVDESSICTKNEYAFIDGIAKNDNSYEWNTSLDINNINVTFKLDTGAIVNVMTYQTFKKLKLNESCLQPTKMILKNYSNFVIPVIGQCKLKCIYKKYNYDLIFYIVKVNSPCILGLRACELLNIIKRVDIVKDVDILEKNDDLFQGIGCLKTYYKIKLKDDVTPIVHAPRKIPFPLIDEFKTLLGQMVKEKIICKVEYPTDWVNSIVLVRKPNGSLRICLDPKDLNKSIRREHYQLPTFDEISYKLRDAKYFSTLDAMSGFWQILLDKNSSDLCTFATPYGRYKFLRLPYGLNCAPEVFHRKFKEVFDIEGVEIYIDDILIYGKTVEEHDKRLLKVLEIARKNNIKFNKSKTKLRVNEITYMGHNISANGIKPDNNKIKAIVDMPHPTSRKGLQRFLGLVTYIGKFIENLSSLTKPLRDLLKKNRCFVWEKCHDDAIKVLKAKLTTSPVLQFYDPNKPVLISTDASKDGIGAVLIQNNLPCIYASKALTDCQKRYAQIEKELYAIVFACEHFHQYIYGKTVTIETDHKPIVQIFRKSLVDCPLRLQRMFIKLQKYDIQLKFKPGKEQFIADTLSRAYLINNDSKSNFDSEIESQVCLLKFKINATDEKYEKIKQATKCDQELIILREYIIKGWPKKIKDVNDNVKIYYKYKDTFQIADDLIYKDNRLFVPSLLRKEILSKIHYSHLGINKSKSLLRESFFWPNMSKQLENLIKNCMTCKKFERNKYSEPMIPHNIPNGPWKKVGCDIFYLCGKTYLLVVDYFSKFIEIAELLDSSSTKQVVLKLKSIFARHGIPEILMSDNGPQYASLEFKEFAKKWQFSHITSSPLYAQSNGLVERHIQTLKRLMKKCVYDNRDIYLALLQYRNTPISNKIKSPAQLLMSRRLRDNLPIKNNLLKPNRNNYRCIKQNLLVQQQKQKKYYDYKTRFNNSNFEANQKVLFKQKLSNDKWEKGLIKSKLNDRPRSYKVQMDNGNVLTRNKQFIQVAPEEELDSTNNDISSDSTGIDNSLEISREVYNVPPTTSSGRKIVAPDRLNYI